MLSLTQENWSYMKRIAIIFAALVIVASVFAKFSGLEGSEKPTSPAHWKCDVDCRGREGYLNKFEIRYDAQKEVFVGKLRQITKDEHNKR